MIRKINNRDKTRILEIAAKTWDGDDYLEQVVDEWLRDKQAEFVGLWENNQLIGFGRMRFLTPQDVWLEGLRKDPDLPFKGIGKKIANYFLDRLSHVPDLKSIRFSTYYENLASIRLNEDLGFVNTTTLSLKNLESDKIRFYPQADNLNKNPDKKLALDFFRKTRYRKLTSGNGFTPLIYRGWVIYPENELSLNYYFKNNYAYTLESNYNIIGLILLCDIHYRQVLWISALEANNYDNYLILLKEAIKAAYLKGKSEIQILVPEIEEFKKACRELEFKSWERENDFLLYEFPIEKLNERK